MHNKRIISALVVIPLVYLAVLWGGFAFYLLVTAIMVSALLELYSMSEFKSLYALKWWGIIASLALVINTYISSSSFELTWYDKDMTPVIITILILGLLFILLIRSDIKKSVISASITLFGVFYVSWMFIHALLLRDMKPYGFEFTISVLILTWVADISAYFVGMKFGRARQLHKVSPNKSRAGALGAVVFSALAMYILKIIFKFYFLSDTEALIMGAISGLLAVYGDLVESMIKRSLDHKDSGKFLPGHGGVLDRIDSVLFTVPFFYYYIKWLVL